MYRKFMRWMRSFQTTQSCQSLPGRWRYVPYFEHLGSRILPAATAVFAEIPEPPAESRGNAPMLLGARSVANLSAAIEKSKSQPLHRLIYALGIRYVGETMAKTLAHAVHHLLDLKDFNEEALQNLEDVGPKVAGSIVLFFSNDDNIEMLKTLENLGLKLQNDKKQLATGGDLQGLTFLFTGTLEKLKRNEAEELVEQNGGQIVSGVSSKLSYLVVGEDAGSKLEKAKKIASIKIISENDFLNMVKKD